MKHCHTFLSAYCHEGLEHEYGTCGTKDLDPEILLIMFSGGIGVLDQIEEVA